MKDGVTLHSNSHESPLPNTVLCQVLLKLTECFWRQKVKNIQCFRTVGRIDRQTDEHQTKHDNKSLLEFQLC